MRFLATIALVAVLAGVLGLWLPFWSLSFTAMVVGFLLRPGAWRALLAGVVAGGLLWGGLAWIAESGGAHIIAVRVGALFGTGATGMLLITTGLGALLGGLGTLLGDRLRRALE